jgi:hypothetical protein
MTPPIPDRVAQRAYDAWVEDEGGCYISTYSTASHGYAQIGWWEGGKSHMTTAHRAAWTHVHGEPAPDHDVDHLPTCDRRCVNIAHLRDISAVDNRRRNKTPFPLEQSCPRGHDPGERFKSKRGMICRLCKNEQGREAYHRGKASA